DARARRAGQCTRRYAEGVRKVSPREQRGVSMTVPHMTVLVVGATGSIGRLVVEETIRQGHTVRALVRTADKARQLPSEAQVAIGDVTQPETLAGAVDGIDAVVFTLGSDGGGKVAAENVDYGGVRNVLSALGSRKVRIALMTAIGVPYTIVRPGWFDYNRSDQHRLVLLQGDTRQAGDSSDGVIARRQIAEV